MELYEKRKRGKPWKTEGVDFHRLVENSPGGFLGFATKRHDGWTDCENPSIERRFTVERNENGVKTKGEILTAEETLIVVSDTRNQPGARLERKVTRPKRKKEEEIRGRSG